MSTNWQNDPTISRREHNLRSWISYLLGIITGLIVGFAIYKTYQL